MPVIECPIEGCAYATPDIEAIIAVALLNTHATVHSVPAVSSAGAKMEQVKRPLISSAGTSEDWTYFLSRWRTMRRRQKLRESP